MQSLAIAASALIAQGTNVGIIADNVANAETPGYAARSASLVSMNSLSGFGGVKVGAIVTAPQPGVDLVGEFANLMLARTAYEAALKVVSTSSTMSNTLLQTI